MKGVNETLRAKQFLLVAVLVLGISLLGNSFNGIATASPMNFSFIQEGFDEGASISGMFTGGDLLLIDGKISTFDVEVSAIMFEFSGNSIVPAFSVNSSDFLGRGRGDFIYNFHGQINGLLGDDPNEGFSYRTGLPPLGLGYIAGPQVGLDVCGVGICGEVNGPNGASSSTQPVEITLNPSPVPEPSMMVLFSTGLAGLGLWRWRRIRQQQ